MASANAGDSAFWEAGLARVDITCPLGVWLSGFGNRTKGAQGVHDRLYATALVLGNGITKVAIVSCDLLALDAKDVQTIRHLVTAGTGIAESYTLVHTTHTHSGPLTSSMHGFGTRDSAYDSVLMRQIASAVALASQRMEHVRLTLGMAEAPIGINRRQSLGGNMIIGRNPVGPVDPRAVVLGVWPLAGDVAIPRGVVLWAAVHPVAFGSGNYLIGRDFPGYALDRLETAFPGTMGLYLSGPCGNINPRDYGTADGFAKARQHGLALAGAAMSALATGREVAPGRLVALQQYVQVPLQPLPPAEVITGERDKIRDSLIASQSAGAGERLAIDGRLVWAEAALAALRGDPGAHALQPYFVAELQALGLGDVALTALPFEVFVEYQAAAARTAPVPDTFVVGYANGTYGYLPTAEAFSEGGYEVHGAYRYYGLQALSPEAPATILSGIAALHRRAKLQMEGSDMSPCADC